MSNHHPLPRLCEEGFLADRYVQRERLEHTIWDWLQDPGTDRTPILSLVGPPGAGKSWLLAHVRQTWEADDGFVLFLTARRLIDHNQHDQVKHEIIELANAACDGLNFPLDLTPALPALIAEISQRLYGHCASQRLLVLIDGCDDLASQEEFDELQRSYLHHFFNNNVRCFRMIMARRLRLTDYALRRQSTSLDVGVFENNAEVNSHCNILLNATPGQAAAWPQLPDGCNYDWNHPYINCYLMYYSQEGALTTHTLANCCRVLLDRAQAANPAGHQTPIADDLKNLALLTQQHANGWTSDGFRDTIGKDFDDTYLRRGLVSARQSDDGMSGPTYRVIDGLRELLAALPEKELMS